MDGYRAANSKRSVPRTATKRKLNRNRINHARRIREKKDPKS